MRLVLLYKTTMIVVSRIHFDGAWCLVQPGWNFVKTFLILHFSHTQLSSSVKCRVNHNALISPSFKVVYVALSTTPFSRLAFINSSMQVGFIANNHKRKSAVVFRICLLQKFSLPLSQIFETFFIIKVEH